MNSEQLNEKMMEDFDADFISDILIASDELQMADSFIEDFMGELNSKDNNCHQFAQDPSIMNWPNQFQNQVVENVPYFELDQTNQQFNHEAANIDFQLQLLPDQDFQQIIQQSDNFGNVVQQTFTNNNIQPNYSEFNNNEMPMVLNNNKRGLKDILENDSNINSTVKSANDLNIFNFEKNNHITNTSVNGNGRKSKSRSINSIINDATNNNLLNSAVSPQKQQCHAGRQIFGTDDNVNFILDQNINEKIFDLNSSGIQLVNDVGTSKPSSFKENSEPFKLLDLSEITPRKPKFKKKTAHNAIEKKYRSSINDKILELKIRVAGPDQKLQKSGILRKTLDYLNNIEDVNTKLCNENKVLRSALKKISLNPTDFNSINDVLCSISYLPTTVKAEQDNNSLLTSPNTPPNSSSSYDSDSIFESFDSPSSLSSMLSSPISPSISINSDNKKSTTKQANATTKPKRTYTKRAKKPEAMLETSRLMLCMFAMSILFFNPFSLILPSSTPLQQDSTNDQSYHPQAAINSRVLNSMDLYEGLGFNASTSVPNSTSPTFDMLQMLGWFLNSIVVFFCLAKVYIGSDPVGADSGEKSSRSNLWMNYQKACQNFQRKNYTESAVLYKQGLRELGLIAPESKSGLIIGIVWQVIRLCLDKVYIGRVFLKLGWWIYGTADFKVYKQSALFYFELHKFAYLNMKSEREVVMATSTKPSTFSYLTGLYYILASYNMCEVYSMDAYLSARDEYNLCEIYFSLILYFKFYVTSSVSKCLVKYLLNQSFLTKKTFLSREQIQVCKLNKLKILLTKSVFIHFLTEFNVKVTFDFEAGQNKSLSLISYKRKLFSFASFLYDSDESVDHFDPILPVEETGDTVVSANGIACDYILSKFQEFILFKMTDQVVNRIGVISTEKILQQQQTADSDFSVGTGCLDCAGDELRELAEVDEIRFDGLLDIYRKNLDYFRYSKSKFSNSVIEETQFTLVQFLKMCNRWKLRNFEVNNGQIDQIKNSYNSEFIESITSVLKACECLSNDPRSALDHCSRAVKSLRNFNDMSGMNARSELVEKFEILINDWLLSAQSQIWTEHKLNNIGMFNETLQNFQTLIVNFPELNFKAKMYETILMYASNRNPINLINPTSKQMFFSNCNKEAFSSMNEILKNFRLQITD